MEWHLDAALVAGLGGAVSGLLVPRIIAMLPEPPVDPEENPANYPDKVPYAELAARPRLAVGSMTAGLLIGAAFGASLGWTLALLWLMLLVPAGIALAAVDYVTWYLPSVLIWPSAGAVLVAEVVAAIVWQEPRVLLLAAIGFAGVGGYYGLLWLLSPRIMAFGDVRLGAVLGLALGPFGVGVLLLSVLVAAVVLAVSMPILRLRGNTIKRHTPFGPFLLIGAVAAVVLGQVLATM